MSTYVGAFEALPIQFQGTHTLGAEGKEFYQEKIYVV